MASQQNPTVKKRAFLAAFAVTCNISRAAKAAKIDRATHYEWLKVDENYKKEFAEAREQAADALEDEAVRRAHEGTEKPIVVSGKREVIREYSDTLLIFLLKGIRPEKYRERSEVKMPGLEAKLADILRARESKAK